MICLTLYSLQIIFEITFLTGYFPKIKMRITVRIYQEETLELNGYLVWLWLEGEILDKNHSNHDHFESNHNHKKIMIPNQIITDHKYHYNNLVYPQG